MGRLSDRIGRRRVVVGAILIFSLLVGISGLATGLFSLLLVRAMMGLADRAYTPPSIVATPEASKPSRHGLNLGLQQMAAPLFGLGIVRFDPDRLTLWRAAWTGGSDCKPRPSM